MIATTLLYKHPIPFQIFRDRLTKVRDTKNTQNIVQKRWMVKNKTEQELPRVNNGEKQRLLVQRISLN